MEQKTKPKSYAHGTCPICKAPALYGSILGTCIITSASDDKVEEIGETQAIFCCPNGHTWPILWIVENE